MGPKLPTPLAAILLAAPLVSQEYRTERDEARGIEFRIHNKLSRTDRFGGAAPRLLYWYEPEEVGDAINTKYGTFNWYMFVLEFPKDLSGVPERQIRARDFRQWATDPDPDVKDREFLVENEQKRARGRQLEHRWWEFRNTVSATVTRHGALRGLDNREEKVDQPVHYVAAVYDLPGSQIALVGVIPIRDFSSLRPDPRFKGYLTAMATSLQVFEPTKPAAEDLGVRDSALRRAERIRDGASGWDFIPGERYAVLYSWDPERNSRKRDSERFATKANELLDRMQELYAQELPAHPKQVAYFPVARISYEYEGFMHNSGTSEAGEVAAFNPQTLEITLFFDKGRQRVRSEAELMSALAEAAWRQHAFFYFYVQTPVDLHRWYEMGLAAWFGSHQVSRSRITYRPDRDRARTIRSAVDEGRYRSLEEFLALSSDEFDARAEEHEAQAWALVDFLKRGAEEEGFDPAWGRILDTYRKSALENRSPRRALADAVEGIDLVALEAAWTDWVKNELR